MLLLIIYIFSILFTELLRDNPDVKGSFTTVPKGMYSLLTQVLCGVDSDFMKMMKEAGIVYYVLFLAFDLLAVLTVMNMLIGVLCDVVSSVSDMEKTESFNLKVQQKISSIADVLDPDKSNTITKEEFYHITR